MRIRKDIDFLTREKKFVQNCDQMQPNFAEQLSEAGDLAADVAELESAMSEIVSLKAQLRAAQARKNDLRRRVEVRASGLRLRLRATPGISDSELAAFGLKPKDRQPTPVGVPDVPPFGMVLKIERGAHVIAFWTQGAKRRRGKPDGVIGAEVWLRIDDKHSESDDFRFHDFVTRSPHRVEHREQDAGKMAFYMVRWMTRRGEKSEFSQTFAATIAG